MGKKRVLISYGVDVDAVCGNIYASLFAIRADPPQAGWDHMAGRTVPAISVAVSSQELSALNAY